METQIAAVNDAMRHGALPEAAALLRELAPVLRGDRAAASFADAVRARAVVEQSAVMLSAHAAALASAQ